MDSPDGLTTRRDVRSESPLSGCHVIESFGKSSAPKDAASVREFRLIIMVSIDVTIIAVFGKQKPLNDQDSHPGGESDRRKEVLPPPGSIQEGWQELAAHRAQEQPGSKML